MLEIREDILHFAWQHKILKPAPLISTTGKEIKIIRQGELNRDAGPDFFNAQIQISDIRLAGNIEVHVRTSDWLKHNHQRDKSYDNIILHLVYHNDTDLEQNLKNNVEVVELKSFLPDNLLKDYSDLINSKGGLACGKSLKNIDDFKFSTWMQRMLIERLEKKTEWIGELFESNQGNYGETFYTVLLRNFGFKTNALPFEILSKHLPVNILLKHSNNLLQLEALLFGAAGLLEEQHEDRYIRNLQNEFAYLKNKYQLIPLQKELFKFSRLRPSNFPTIRLAQFAFLVNKNPALFQSPHIFRNIGEIKNVLSIETSQYWKCHYNIDGSEVSGTGAFGRDSVENVLINTFATFLFFYARKTGLEEFQNLSFKILEECDFETNIKTRNFSSKKQAMKSAADSQAAIHLYDNYCTKRKCLHCGIAAAVLK